MNPVLKQSKTCEISNLGNDLLIHDVSKGKVHVLNVTAKRIWELCSMGMESEEIASELMKEFKGGDPASIISDVKENIKSLVNKKLLIEEVPRAENE